MAIVDQYKRHFVVLKVLKEVSEDPSAPNKINFELLLMKCWQIMPDTFGLTGFKHLHPDSRTLANVIYGARGLVNRKLIKRDEDMLFSIGPGGPVHLAVLEKGVVPFRHRQEQEKKPKDRVPLTQEKPELKAIQPSLKTFYDDKEDTNAMDLACSDRFTEISYHKALVFLGLDYLSTGCQDDRERNQAASTIRLCNFKSKALLSAAKDGKHCWPNGEPFDTPDKVVIENIAVVFDYIVVNHKEALEKLCGIKNFMKPAKEKSA